MLTDRSGEGIRKYDMDCKTVQVVYCILYLVSFQLQQHCRVKNECLKWKLLQCIHSMSDVFFYFSHLIERLHAFLRGFKAVDLGL